MAIITEEPELTNAPPETKPNIKPKKTTPPPPPTSAAATSKSTTTTTTNPFHFWFYFTLVVSLISLLFIFLSSLAPQDPKTWFLNLPPVLRDHYSKGRTIKVQTAPNYPQVEVFSIQEGPTNSDSHVLFVHGLGCSSFAFRSILRSLGLKNVHAVAIDLPGSGFSDKSMVVVEENVVGNGVFGNLWNVYSDIKEKGLFWGFDQLIEQGYVNQEQNEIRVLKKESVKAIELGGEEMGRVLGQVVDSIGPAPVDLVLHDSALGLSANWISKNRGSVRSVVVLDAVASGTALPLWVLEVPLVKKIAMAKLSLLFLSFTFLFLFGGCLAQLGSQQQFLWQELQQQQQHRLRAKTDCRIERLTAQEPTRKYESEAGYTEYWDRNNDQFECAGVAAVKTFIQRQGLFLPHYNNVAQLIYVVQGKGLLGAVIPGCAETFETEIPQQQEEQQQQGSESQQQFFDRHQKVRQFRQGDVLALPPGITLWLYNNGQEPLVTVSLLDTANELNQLDLKFRNFFLAGNQNPQQGQGQQQEESESEGESPSKNIHDGFSDEVLAEAYNVEREIIEKLKGEKDQRGRIVKAERFNVVFPREGQEEQQQGRATSALKISVEQINLKEINPHLQKPLEPLPYHSEKQRRITRKISLHYLHIHTRISDFPTSVMLKHNLHKLYHNLHKLLPASDLI